MSPDSATAPVGIVLLHYPVYDRNGRTVVSAITNLDLHDIARAARTFGLFRYYVVTPAKGQQQMAAQIIGHWREGWGATYNPKRKVALDQIRVKDTLDEVVGEVTTEFGEAPRLVATGAAATATTGYSDLREKLRTTTQPHLLIFGTGWGLADEVLACADEILPPVKGAGDYNHLSVRSAAAIILDRLLGR